MAPAIAVMTSVLVSAGSVAYGQANPLAQAQAAMQRGDNDKAITFFLQAKDAIQDDESRKNDMEFVYYGLGAVYFNTKQFPQAATQLLELIQKFPQSKLVPEAQFFVAQCFYATKEWQKAVDAFKVTAKIEKYKEESLLFMADALRQMSKPNEAAEPLKTLISGGVKNANTARGAIQLALYYNEQGDTSNTIDVLNKISNNLRVLPNVSSFNDLVIIIGDKLLVEYQKPTEALQVYRLLRRRDEVISLQSSQIQALTRQVEGLKNQLSTAPPQRAGEINGQITRQTNLINEVTKQLDELRKKEDPTIAVLVRMGKAYYDVGKKWESVTVFDELSMRYPTSKERETALFAMIATYPELGQVKKARDLCDEYIKDFPKGEKAEEVSYLKGVVTLEENADLAIQILTDLIKNNPNTKYREDASIMIANAKFNNGKFDEAYQDYDTFIKTFPTGKSADEARYRMPLSLVFSGKYEDAIKELNSYIKAYPESVFVEDAKYRLMICYFAAAANDRSGNLYRQIIKLTEQFMEKHGGSRISGEVFALRGDCYAGLNELPPPEEESDRIDNLDLKAAEAYMEGFKTAQNDQALQYNLFEAVKIWQREGQWKKINETLGEFVRQNPDSSVVPTAKYWIGRSLTKMNKEDEAKAFYAKEIKAGMSLTRRDAVEMMIQQLVQILTKKKRATINEDGTMTPPVETLKPEEELEKLIGGEETDKSRTATARLFYAKSLIAERRQEMNMRTTYLDQLADFEASELSASLLGISAEHFMRKGREALAAGNNEEAVKLLERSDKFCQELISSHPKSDFVEFAYVTRGDIFYQKKEYAIALQWYKDAIDVAGAESRQAEAVMGQARCLLELGKYDEAKKLFEQVASTKEWRGQLTAESMFLLGELEFRQQKWKEAHAYFQKTYVAYQKYVDIMGQSYLRAAECLVKINDTTGAVNTLGDMQRQEKIPVKWRDQARAQLKTLGVQ